MFTQNGLTAEVASVNLCRPWYPGHENGSGSNLALGFLIHDIEDQDAEGVETKDDIIMFGDPTGNSGIMGVDWLDKPDTESSVHFGVSPDYTAQCGSVFHGCWGAGPEGNGFLVQAEQSGMANYKYEQWTDEAGMKQLNRMAQLYAEVSVLLNWSEPHWATEQEWKANANGSKAYGYGGAGYHADVTAWLGGTTHDDPTGGQNPPQYPGKGSKNDLFMPLAVAKWKALKGIGPVVPPVTPPANGDIQLSATQYDSLVALIKAIPTAGENRDAIVPEIRKDTLNIPASSAAAVWNHEIPNTRFPAGTHNSTTGNVLMADYAMSSSALILFKGVGGVVGLANLWTHTWRPVSAPELMAFQQVGIPQFKNMQPYYTTAAGVLGAFGPQITDVQAEASSEG